MISTEVPRSSGEAGRRPVFGARFVTAVSLGSMLNPINSSVIAVALGAIGAAFGAGADRTTWLVSALYLATAVGQPTMGRLSDRLGPRRVYLAGTALVGAGGLVGCLGWSLPALVAARVVIGLGTSAAYPAAMAMVRRRARRLRGGTPDGVLSALAIAGQVSMAVGPPLGGLLIAAGGWRMTFLVNVPLALAGMAAALAWLPKDDPRRTRTSLWRTLDPIGVLVFTAALTALLVFLMDLADPGWWLLGASLALLALLTAWELRADAPFIDMRMLAHNRALTTTYVRYGVTMLVTYCFVYGWTLWLEQATGRSASAAGLLMLPSFAVATAVSAFAARRRVWPSLVAGAAALSLGCGGLLLLGRHTPLWALLLVSTVFGVQNGLNIVTNQAAMYAQAPAEQTGAAAGLLRTFMYLGAIASAGLIGLAYGPRATDAGLHHLAAGLTAVALALLVVTTADRTLAKSTK